MTDPANASWVTPALVAGKTIGLSELRVWRDRLFWLESRPAEGRNVIVQALPDGSIGDVGPDDLNIGTRVHEYGGGAFAVAGDGSTPVIVASDRGTGVVWRLHDGGVARLGGAEGLRFADFTVLPDGSAAIAVREDHRAMGDAGQEPAAALVWLDGADPAGVVLATGADFYASPRLSPDGGALAWIEWDHPAMPWDATRLMMARVVREGGARLLDPRVMLDGASVMEPLWLADGSLVATSDAGGFWNPTDIAGADLQAAPTSSWPLVAADIGLPHWVFGQTTMTQVATGAGPALVCLAIERGVGRVLLLTRHGVAQDLDLGAPQAAPVLLYEAGDLVDATFAWIDAPPDAPARVVTGRPGEAPTVLRRATDLPANLSRDAISRPEALAFPADGGEAHAFYYPPSPSALTVEGRAAPPLVAMVHGGPTGRAGPAFAFKVQWWTSRGFAVLDVNYRGSTGFGRAYRQALAGRWAALDVADVIAGVQFAIATGRADPRACVIRGSSAGGLTVLNALAQSDVFAAGTSLYGVTDLRALATGTHKFEARYLDSLVGPYPAQEAVYLQRSPTTQAGAITAPVLFLHGADDKVVPPAQAADMVELLRGRGIAVDHHVYAGEGHGFRQEATLMDAQARELAFYRRVLATRGTPDDAI